MSKVRVAPSALVLAVLLSSCVAATSVPTPTESAPKNQTAASSPAPTEPPEPTVAASRNVGLVWASAVDDRRVNAPRSEQPAFDGGHGIKTWVDMVLYLDASEDGETSKDCADVIRDEGKRSDTHCIFIQWSMDVPKKYGAEAADIMPGSLLTPKGRQLDQSIFVDGMPGAKGVTASALYPGATPGSKVQWMVGSGDLGRKTLTYKIPSESKMIPITFD